MTTIIIFVAIFLLLFVIARSPESAYKSYFDKDLPSSNSSGYGYPYYPQPLFPENFNKTKQREFDRELERSERSGAIALIILILFMGYLLIDTLKLL